MGEQTERFQAAIQTELLNQQRKELARLKYLTAMKERKARLAQLREKAIVALASVEADPSIPQDFKNLLAKAGRTVLDHQPASKKARNEAFEQLKKWIE